MRLFFLIIFLILFLPYFTNAQEVKVRIEEILQSEIIGLKYNSLLEPGEAFKTNFDLFNSGSIGYSARVRLDILNQTELYYTGWSEEKSLWPGSSAYFEVYWFPANLTGDFQARVMIYHANEIKELEPIEFKIVGIGKPEKNIEITDFETHENLVEVRVKTNKELKNLVVVPSGYPYGWIFEQSKIESISRGEEKKVELKYEPTIWEPINVTMHLFTEDGKHYSSELFMMERKKPSVSFVSYFIEILRIFSIIPFF